MQIIDGKLVSQKVLVNLREKISNYQGKINLDIVLVGEDPASLKYVEMKNKKAAEIGIGGAIHRLPANIDTQVVLDLITKLNNDPNVTAFMVQLPLPDTLQQDLILNSIHPSKDADGLNSVNLGLLFHNDPKAIPSATPKGIMTLLDEYQINLDGKKVVIVGRSPMIGLPLFALIQNKNATVTIAHSHTPNLEELTLGADIIISAAGIPKIITSSMVKDGAVIIDVGTNYIDGRLVGDVDFESVAPKCSFITPVPGGVGPMTIASLLENTVNIFLNQQ